MQLSTYARTRHRFLIIIIIIIGILLVSTCLLALYLLCTKRLSSDHIIELDYIIDVPLAREAALKLAPEPI
jgi:phage gp36-like protein